MKNLKTLEKLKADDQRLLGFLEKKKFNKKKIYKKKSFFKKDTK
jgi:hypothetical protein